MKPAGDDAPVVTDTTPLINLAGVGLLALLPLVYGEIWTPVAVTAEYNRGVRPGDPDLAILPWLRVREVPADLTLPQNLGAGEKAAIALASASQARLILLDERLGRRVAVERGLQVAGTLAVLVRAKRLGLLPAVRPVLELMTEQGRRIGAALAASVLRAAGEES